MARWVKNPNAVAHNCAGRDTIPTPEQGVKGSGIAAAAMWFSPMAQIQSLAGKLPYVLGVAVKKKFFFFTGQSVSQNN